MTGRGRADKMMKTLIKQLRCHHQRCLSASTNLSVPSTVVPCMRTLHQLSVFSRHWESTPTNVLYHTIRSMTLTENQHKCLFSCFCMTLMSKQLILNTGDCEFLEFVGVNLQKLSSKVISKENSTTSVKSLVRFLEESHLTNKQIVAVIEKYPRIALVDPLELENRFNVLHDLGIQRDDVHRLFVRAPSVFSRVKTSSHFEDFVVFLRGMGLQNQHIVRVVTRSPLLLNRVKNIRSVVDYLRDVFQEHGCEDEFPRRIRHLLVQDPLLFVQSVPVIKEKINFLSDLKISGRNIIRVMYNCPNALRSSNDHKLTTINYIKDRLHLTQDELIDLIVFYPQLLYFSVEKLHMNIDFLYSEGFTARHIVSKPAVLTRSLSLLKQRCEELKAVNFEFSSFNVFLVNPQKYQERLDKLRGKSQ